MKRPGFALCSAHGLRAAALLLSVTLGPVGFADAPTPAAPATLESLGLQPSGPPVREHPGWRAPKLILVSPALHDQLAPLREVAPGVKFIEMPQASARDIAAADAALRAVLRGPARQGDAAAVDSVARRRRRAVRAAASRAGAAPHPHQYAAHRSAEHGRARHRA